MNSDRNPIQIIDAAKQPKVFISNEKLRAKYKEAETQTKLSPRKAKVFPKKCMFSFSYWCIRWHYPYYM